MNYRHLTLTCFIAPVLLSLGACASITDKSVQDITVITPGVQNSICYLYVEGLKYRTRPPETTTISKSSETLVADCFAPGNKHKKAFYQPSISNSVFRNITNAGLGLPWDYASAAIYAYPDTITIDFTNTPVTAEPMPAQNQPDIKQPEEYPLEEILPGRPRMNSDRDELPVEIQRREKSDAMIETDKYVVETGGGSKDKGDLQKSAAPQASPGVKKDLNPSGAPAAAVAAPPAPAATPAKAADTPIPAPARSPAVAAAPAKPAASTPAAAGPPAPLYPGE